MVELIYGDCLEEMKNMEDNSIDAIVSDPPYGLSFMGKKWDYDVPSVEIWQECLRVLKPGGYLLSFAGTRTQHRMACNIEDAGFEIRDMIAWVYGSGFPKSLNIGKAIDKLQGNEREEFIHKYASRRVAHIKSNASHEYGFNTTKKTDTKGTSEWEGWGSNLKPALEPITMARKPLSEKTIAKNVLKWGTGCINIDCCRVEYQGEADKASAIPQGRITTKSGEFAGRTQGGGKDKELDRKDWKDKQQGRFPANLIHSGEKEVVDMFPNNSSRFFYQPKASKKERNAGCEDMEEQVRVRQGLAGEHKDTISKNFHPTVKPIALMEYLVKLVSREGAVVLDPFTGSGSTGIACKNLNRDFIGIELDEGYCKIAEKRINV